MTLVWQRATIPVGCPRKRACKGESSVPSHAIVLGGNLAGVRAARRLAAAGLSVTLLEPSPFLGREALHNGPSWMAAVPELLEATHDPRIAVLTQAEVHEVLRQGERYLVRATVHPRYVDAARCTGCGECEAVCPVQRVASGNGTLRRAIYRDPPLRAVPNLYAIEKRGAAPCAASCPGGIHVQGFVALIARGRFQEAYDLIAQAIPFPGICGRVCDHPCEARCSRSELDRPVAIRALKRFVADQVAAGGGPCWERVPPDSALPPVAVIGAGPAGLTVAWELARAGVRVTVFEALPVAGGMMAVGIPAYRLPREVLRREIAAIQALGVEIRLNSRLGPDLTLDDLFSQGYGAVFLGMGAHRSRALDVPGETLAGVIHATELLRSVALAQEATGSHRSAQAVRLGRRAVVVGGGNSAIDAARTLLRLGVEEVSVLYRRSRREMPALPEEVSAAEEEGVVVEELVGPVRLIGSEGRVVAIECVRMELGEPDASGRARPVPVPGSEFVVETDTVVVAVGQEPDFAGLPPELTVDGRLQVDPATGATPRPGVFAGGDMVRPATVIEAIGAGKRAARSILRYLRGEAFVPEAERRPIARPSAEELGEQPRLARQEPPTLPARRRRRLFEEVEKAFTPEQAVTEASRCLSCAVCSECLACVAACRAHAIDHALFPRDLLLQADLLVDAGGYRLELPEEALQAAETGAEEKVRVATASRGVAVEAGEAVSLVAQRPGKIGLFLCRCGGQIAEALGLEALAVRFRAEPGISHVEIVDQACIPEGLAQLRRAAAGLDAAVLGGCSCCNLAQVCFACTTQRLRCREGLGVWESVDGVPPPWAWEYVNLREQCVRVYGPEEAFSVACELLEAAVARLRSGPVVPVVATVDRGRCRTCDTCVEVCRAGALRLEGEGEGGLRLVVEGERCLACGTCAAHCPTGALEAGRVGDRQLEATIEAFLSGGGGKRLLVFLCNWGGQSGLEATGLARQELPSGVRLVRVPCLGRLSPGLLLRALERGAAGILLAGCVEGGCRYEFGRERAMEVVSRAQALVRLLGLGERLAVAGVHPGDGVKFHEAVVRAAARFCER